MSDVLFFDAITADVAPRVGGKGESLARMSQAGLPVPPGFVVATGAYLRSHTNGIRSDAKLADAVREAYRTLGDSAVAVRSSATAEDGAETSFAGQQETILDVTGEEAVLDAIDKCWKSLHTERAVAYRLKQGVNDDGLAMAVVVQTLVPAEVAGVLFTRDPSDAAAERMLAEASWGLGEVVVSGRVSPDRFTLSRTDGTIIEKHLGTKEVEIRNRREVPVTPDRQQQFCLSDTALSQLVALGKQVEAFYGNSRDIEWAYVAGAFSLLQARPITAGSERDAIRLEIVAGLQVKAESRGTVWVRYNLSEVLPEPTPMTWGIVQRLLAADGGFGAMNRDLGAQPDASLGSEGAFDLVAGRPMANLSRMPRLQFARPPFEYPLAAFRANPKLALDPKPTLNPLRDGWKALFRLPGIVWRLSRMSSIARRRAETFAVEFRTAIAPPFVAEAQAALAQNWATLDPPALVAILTIWVKKTLVEFARDSLKPTVFADMMWNGTLEMLVPKLGEARAKAAIGELALGAKPDDGTDYADGIRRFAAGQLTHEAFLSDFGHRCANEMELAQPRWSEDPAAVARLKATQPMQATSHTDNAMSRILDEAKIAGPFRDKFTSQVAHLRTYLGLRETAKHQMLRGYAVIRRALVELDSRFQLRGGIFFLTLDDLPDLLQGKDLSARIAQRKKRRQAELALELPPVLFSDDLAAIGRALPPPEGATIFQGVALSAGVAEGPALVLNEPHASLDVPDGFILVCPSTDPMWVPLFARARGLVMETGGVLSHGAIVAREFGLPAVAGLPGITRQLVTGTKLRVDGGSGSVAIVN